MAKEVVQKGGGFLPKFSKYRMQIRPSKYPFYIFLQKKTREFYRPNNYYVRQRSVQNTAFIWQIKNPQRSVTDNIKNEKIFLYLFFEIVH